MNKVDALASEPFLPDNGPELAEEIRPPYSWAFRLHRAAFIRRTMRSWHSKQLDPLPIIECCVRDGKHG